MNKSLILILLLSVYFQPYNHLTSIIYCLVIIIWFYLRPQKGYDKYLKSLYYVIGISLIIGLFRGHELFAVFRDLYYAVVPIVAFMLGIILASKYGFKQLCTSMVYTAIIISLYTIAVNIMQYGFDYLVNPRTYRDNDDSFVSMPAIITSSCFYCIYLIISKQDRGTRLYFITFLLLLSTYLSGSRTFILSLLLSIAALIVIYYKINPVQARKYLYFAGVLSFVYMLYSAALADNMLLNISLDEFKMGDFTDQSDINNYYRGYESYVTISQIQKENYFFQIFGSGEGATVYMPNSPVGLDYLPIVHNGYAYLWLKFGLVGAFVFIMFFLKKSWKIIKTPKGLINDETFLPNTFILSCSLAMLLMNSSVTAMFNAGYIFPVTLIAASMYHLQTYEKQ